MIPTSKYEKLTLATILAFLAFRIFYIATTHYNLIADEAYFWDWSRHPDLSYYDMGPMIAWVIRFFTFFPPLSEFSVRLAAPLFSAFSAFVVYKLSKEIIGSSKLVFVTILIFHITPIATAGGVIITYYSPQLFFMTMTAFSLWRLVAQKSGVWWYLIGLSLGLGFLSHHIFSIISAEVILFFLISKAHRIWFKRKEPYIAIIIALFVSSPVWIWNLIHQSVMAKHAFGLMHVSPDVMTTLGLFLAGQAGVHTPFLFLAVLYGIGVSGYKGILKNDDKHLFLFCLSAPLLVFIALLCFGGRTEANWPISAYVTGSIAAVIAVNSLYETSSQLNKKLIIITFAMTLFLCLSTLTITTYPQLLHTVGTHIPPRIDPANRLYGWDTLGKEVSAQRKTMAQSTFISARDYGISALLAFYVEGNPEVYELPDGRRMSQYDIWNKNTSVVGKNAIFVDKRSMRSQTRALFENVELIKKLIIKAENDDSVRKIFYIYKCYNYKGSDKKIGFY